MNTFPGLGVSDKVVGRDRSSGIGLISKGPSRRTSAARAGDRKAKKAARKIPAGGRERGVIVGAGQLRKRRSEQLSQALVFKIDALLPKASKKTFTEIFADAVLPHVLYHFAFKKIQTNRFNH
jgi:hypothetical protein